jgi:hypothetical protein
MKRHAPAVAVIALAVIGAVAWYMRPPTPTVLTVRIGKPFTEVVRDSTYPVFAKSMHPAEHGGFGATDITEPSVILRFDDPKHGFILPPTKFVAITYLENRVVTISTSPMLKKLPFDEAVALLAQLQDQFKAGGWQPWPNNGSVWFDLTPAGRQRLYEGTFVRSRGGEQWLYVPDTYAMTFRIKCASGCTDPHGHNLFLIDIGLSEH